MILSEDQRVNVVVRALIFRDNRLLATQWRHRDVAFAIGGRVEFGEPLIETLRREVLEEVGAHIVESRLVYFSENIFTMPAGPAYHEYGWYFLAEPDHHPCRLDEVVPNPDHPNLIIRYLAVDEQSLRDFRPRFLCHYIPGDHAQGFSQNPRHIYSREHPNGRVEVQELKGMLVGCA